jgi:hypothetical protein
MPASSTQTLIHALRILARDIETADGVANMALREAADRLETYYVKEQRDHAAKIPRKD